ncbi:Solute carrier family 2, facilitated glucose transporter member 1 [Zancudomyces culisetae]|uniref:Solute carrier family 2, facilitated glucose transporter member 1 n=1 Tax=Zancudomyces culisetae TaxID=1213189 RepID=A0A1R1PG70_ZANCU|nr:Solute carrier family 2, facilitated glucose transporter member 1 [Zancudomyces culisetae]|eukprot:OMH79974.1 Solute carrier family 2, facilitated glucose transporter member 1 [Zancudomyces culisetae]
MARDTDTEARQLHEDNVYLNRRITDQNERDGSSDFGQGEQLGVVHMNSRITSYCLMCGIFVSLAAFQTGYKIAELNNPKESIINCEEKNPGRLPLCLPMTENYFAFATSIFAIGALVGSFVAGHLANSYGRKKSILYNNVIYFIGSGLEAFAVSPLMLVYGRFICGVASGIAVVVTPMYLTEIAPIHSRGSLNMLNQINIVVGILVSQLMGYFFGNGSQWRIILGLGMGISALQVILLQNVVESPRFYFIHNRNKEAEDALKRLRRINNVTQELNSWVESTSRESEELLEHQGDGGPVSGVVFNVNASYAEIKHYSIFSILKERKYRCPLTLAVILQLGQQFSGINTVFFYSTSIFSSVFSPELSVVLTLLVGFVNVLCTFVAALVVDKTDRKFLLFASMGSMFLSLGLLTLATVYNIGYMMVFSIFLVVASFAPGFGPLPFLIVTEIFDSKAIAAGSSWSIATNYLGTFLVGSTFFYIQSLFGKYAFVPFMVLLVFFGVLYHVLLPETKGRSVEQISRSFRF